MTFNLHVIISGWGGGGGGGGDCDFSGHDKGVISNIVLW